MKIDGMNDQLQFQTGNDDHTYLYGSGIQFTDTKVKEALRSETWNNIVLTGDGKNLTLYINGTSASAAYTPTTDALISNFQLGSTWGDGVRKIDADMDDLAIWNRVLDTKEIAALTSGSTALSVVVPEPTTATLSLPALAGLAARRRRQARGFARSPWGRNIFFFLRSFPRSGAPPRNVRGSAFLSLG
ncbi:MAG: LamG-like jellyroll fold domain-containing protein [Akkermansia sp.]